MRDFVQDTVFGKVVRFVTRRKYLQYPEERDPTIWRRYIDPEKSDQTTLRNESVPNQSASDREDLDDERKRSVDAEKNSDDESPSRVRAEQNPPNNPDPESGRDILLVTWYGPDDPENPQNWTIGKKFFVSFTICLLTFSIYIGSAIFAAGIVDIERDFGVSQVAATLGLTMFVAGYGLGPMLWSPMSEVPYIGRNPIYFLTLLVFVIFQVPTALSVNFGMLLAFRFLTGFFGSPVLATGGASLGDMYAPRKRAYAICVWGISAVCGPTMGPLIGGFAAEAKGWTWTIWELMWLSGFCLVFIFFFLPETSSANILYRRTKRLRKLTGNQKLKCEPEIQAEHMTGKEVALMILVRPFTLNFTEPMVFLLNLYIALIYGLLYIWFESFPIVFIQIHGFTLGQLGLAYLGIFVGALVVIPPFFYYLHRVQENQFNERGEIKPEYRLPPSFFGGLCIPICLFWFGWSSRPDVHWIMPIIGSAWFSVGATLLFNSVLNYLADAYPEYVASVLAGNDIMRSSFGAGFPLFATAMYKNLGVDWASSTLAFLGIAFIPIPFVLYKYGERLRKISKHARKDF